MATSPDRTAQTVSADVSWRTVVIPAAGHVVPVRVLTPAQPSGWLVWVHGGSWSRGSAEQWHAPCADLAARSSCVVVSVDYRLAPRHEHPAPLDDVLTAMTWVQEQMDHEGTHATMLAVGGDSAGGTLAASAALAWRNHGRPLAAQLLAYPPLDPSCDAASYASAGRFPDRSTMRAAWAAHLGSATPTSSPVPYRSPLDADTLTDVAPVILAVGDLDPVRDDVSAYARRLRQSDIQVTHRVFRDTAHGAFLAADTDSQLAPIDAIGEREPTMRAWLAATVRNYLDSHLPSSPPSEGPR